MDFMLWVVVIIVALWALTHALLIIAFLADAFSRRRRRGV